MDYLPAILAVALSTWGIALGISWLPRRLCPILVRWAGTSALLAGLLAVSVQVVGLAAFSLGVFLIRTYVTGNVPLALVALLFTLLGVVYAPIAGMAFPDRAGPPYGVLRQHLREAGATLGQERAAAWVGGPFPFLGIAAILSGGFAALGTF